MLRKILIAAVIFTFLVAFSAYTAAAAINGISKVDVVSNYKDLTGDVWLVQFTDNGYSSDQLGGTLTKDDVYSLTNGRFTSDNSFTLSVDASDNGCYYRITKSDTQRVFTIDAVKKDFWVTDRASRDNYVMGSCVNGNAFIKEGCSAAGVPFLQDCVWCFVRQTDVGTKGEIGAPQYEFSATWSLNVPGKPAQTATVCSGIHTSQTCSGISAKIGSYAYVEWQGSLDSGKKCEIAGNEYAVHSNSFSNGWRVVDKAKYDSFNDYWFGLKTYQYDLQNWANGAMSESGVESKANGLAYAAIAQKQSGSFASQWPNANPIIESSSIDSGKIRWSPADGDKLTFPNFNIYVDGNYFLKVIRPCGEPDITGASIGTIQEGLSQNLNMNVKNVGSASGGFEVRVSGCSQYFSPDVSTKSIQLAAGASGTVTIPIGFSTDVKTQSTFSGTCTVQMTSICAGGKTDSYTITVTGKQMQECTPGQKACSADRTKVIACNAAGLLYEELMACPQGQTCEGNACVSVGVCGNNKCDSGETVTCPGDCATAVCGDGRCSGTESVLNCAQDCGGGSGGGGTPAPAFDLTYLGYAIVIILIVVFVALALRERSKPKRRMR